MNDRGMKKWRPFNSVASPKELMNKPANFEFPNLSEEEIKEYEELLSQALYTSREVKITYIEKGSKKCIVDYIKELDSIKKDVVLVSKKINFRQIYKIELEEQKRS